MIFPSINKVELVKSHPNLRSANSYTLQRYIAREDTDMDHKYVLNSVLSYLMPSSSEVRRLHVSHMPGSYMLLNWLFNKIALNIIVTHALMVLAPASLRPLQLNTLILGPDRPYFC